MSLRRVQRLRDYVTFLVANTHSCNFGLPMLISSSFGAVSRMWRYLNMYRTTKGFAAPTFFKLFTSSNIKLCSYVLAKEKIFLNRKSFFINLYTDDVIKFRKMSHQMIWDFYVLLYIYIYITE